MLSGVPLAISAWLLAGCVIRPAPPAGSIDSLQRLDALDRPWPGVEHPLLISFDEHLIPSIHAGSQADAAYGLGLVHAHLRIVQMELFRRISQGRISESAGPFANGIDHAIRAIDLGRAVPEIERQLPPETRAWLERYVEGINDYLASIGTPSPEAKSLGLSLAEPWTVADVLTVGRLASVDITWGRWLALLPKRNDTGFDDFIRRLDAFADAGRPSFGPDIRQPLSAMMDVGRTGSNAFVVHASRSATGGALVASDPHLGLVAPNAWCVVGYSYGDVSVVGLTLPGLPFVVVGRNSDIAWTGTNMQSVSSGLYELPTDFVPTEITRENLRTRLWFDRTREIRQTTIGPVISDAGLFSNLTYGDTALRWRGHMPSDESTAFLKVSTATTWDDFRSAFATYAVGGQNMLFADKEGNIGQILAIEAIPGAAMSARLGAASSDRAASDWDNTIPSTGLPFAFNPPGGLLVSANNTPVLLDPPLVPQGNTNDRLDRITALLSAHDDLDLNVLASIQRDTFSQASLTTAQTMASVASGLDLDLVQLELITTIRQWDGHYEPSSNGAAAYQVLLSALIDKLYADRYSDGLQEMIRSGAYVHDFVAEDLREPGSAPSLKKALGSATRSWTTEMVWGDIHRLSLGHPIGLIPVLGSSYRFIDEPWPGSTTTVNKSAHAITAGRHQTFFGANARLLIDMANPDASRVVLLGGQDGRVGSTAIIDQVPLWREGRFIPLPLSREGQVSRAKRFVRIEPTATANPERTTASYQSEANP
jgi:penicillin amidase